MKKCKTTSIAHLKKISTLKRYKTKTRTPRTSR